MSVFHLLFVLPEVKVKVFIIMHYLNGLQQKEITIYKKSNIKTALNYINVKSKNVRSDQRSLGFRVGFYHVQLTGV